MFPQHFLRALLRAHCMGTLPPHQQTGLGCASQSQVLSIFPLFKAAFAVLGVGSTPSLIPWCILLLKYQEISPPDLLLYSPAHPLLLSSTAHSTQCSHTCITFPSPNPPERLSLLKHYLPSQGYSNSVALYCHFRSAKIWKQSTANWSNKEALITVKPEQNI